MNPHRIVLLGLAGLGLSSLKLGNLDVDALLEGSVRRRRVAKQE